MRRIRGFTLIEVMVVMAILAGLIGGVTIVVGQAQKKKMVFMTKARVAALAAAIEQMKAPEKLGIYPPTQASLIMTVKGGNVGKTLGAMNDKNAGIESVFVCCNLQGVGVKPASGFDEEGAIANFDNDSAAQMIPNMAKADLFEYCDAWGNPLVYINARDYKGMQKLEQYVLQDGTVVKVEPRASGTTGGYARDTSFQLFSIGPDAIPGTEDDIHWGD